MNVHYCYHNEKCQKYFRNGFDRSKSRVVTSGYLALIFDKLNQQSLSLYYMLSVKFQIKQQIQMRAKEKLIKEKQEATEKSSIKHVDSTPLLMRLQKEYLYNQNNGHITERQNCMDFKANKQNRLHMINSVPGSSHEYNEKGQNIIKIDNYEGKRFKTQTGYVPEMTKSRYQGPYDLGSIDQNVYSSQERIILRKDKNKMKNKINKYQSVEFNSQYERPLTFGLIKQADPLKSSIEYHEDRKIKNQALAEIELRRSQETLLNSKDYEGEVLRCANHPNKKAKYRLITDYEQKDYEDDMIYCSKCAINLLQQGFKVEQLKHPINITKSNCSQKRMLTSRSNHSRVQDIRNYEQKILEVEQKLNKNIDSVSEYQLQISGVQRDLEETETVYDYLLDILQQMKTLDLDLLRSIKEKKAQIHDSLDKQLMTELESVGNLKKQIKEHRNKYIIMKESEYQQIIQQNMRKLNTYGNFSNLLSNGEQLDYRKCEVSEKVDRIMESMWNYGKQIEKGEQQKSELTSALKSNQQLQVNNNENQVEDDEFMCQQIKRPFRTLFPDSDLEQSSRMLARNNEPMGKKILRNLGNKEKSNGKNSGFYQDSSLNSESPKFKN